MKKSPWQHNKSLATLSNNKIANILYDFDLYNAVSYTCLEDDSERIELQQLIILFITFNL